MFFKILFFKISFTSADFNPEKFVTKNKIIKRIIGPINKETVEEIRLIIK